MADEQRETGLSGARPPDDYEAKYMAGDGVIHRDKIRVPGWFFLLFVLPIAIQAVVFGGVALSPAPVPLSTYFILPATALSMTLLALLFAVLRITVTRRQVIVQYGVFGPKIPIESITSCEAVKYDWMDYGGWGIRRGRDGSWAYNMVGDAGRAVRIEWKSPAGKKNVTLVASPNPDALARAVNEARSGALRPAAKPVSRFATEPDMAEFEAEAEAEAEAVLAEEAKEEKK